jgi:deoxyadenosine/deoxycytidine kinase
MTRRIYMTGVMSSGKTSIASALAKHFVGSLYKEEINETLLSNTFQKKNPDGNLALLTQLDFLIKLVDAHDYKLKNDTQVIDTSFITNSIFTDIVVPKRHMDTYEELLKSSIDMCKGDNDYNVLIEVPYEVMIQRIKDRAREYEQTDTFDYKKYYNAFVMTMDVFKKSHGNNPRTIVVCNDGSMSIDDIAKIIKDKIMEIELYE